jgi:cation diffusion facilitator CzcD-associated flavoprotein CzcO
MDRASCDAPPVEHVDVLIVGAGISGIDAAYHVQTKCPQKTYAVLEGRAAMGGTWDLFRYPGIRSDSDMYTLGFPFRPWTDEKSIADGDTILSYVKETARVYGIDKKIRYNTRVQRARWSSETSRWTVELGDGTQLTCSFLHLCVGYYDYDAGYTPELAGRDKFRGRIVHPQFWTNDIAYANKRVIVIGSGATAVTLVPELAKQAAHVVMLQRSPTYVMSVPAKDPIARQFRKWFSSERAFSATRWKNVLVSIAFYQWCRRFPAHAKRVLVNQVTKQLGDADAVAKHFTPSYRPWDQRLCFIPDNDLFVAINDGRASVVTDHIDTFTERGIRLRSGTELEADLVVTATGLEMKSFGKVMLEVDGKRVEPQDTMVYRGMMCSDVPNMAFSTGYTNASWTLKCDLTSRYVCRLINYMDKHGYTRCVPRRDPTVAEVPLIDFSSGYVQRVIDRLPKQGSIVPWKLYQNYARDLLLIERGKIADDVMEFGSR